MSMYNSIKKTFYLFMGNKELIENKILIIVVSQTHFYRHFQLLYSAEQTI